MNIIQPQAFDISFNEYVERHQLRHQLLWRKHLAAMTLEESGGIAAIGYHHTWSIIDIKIFFKYNTNTILWYVILRENRHVWKGIPFIWMNTKIMKTFLKIHIISSKKNKNFLRIRHLKLLVWTWQLYKKHLCL